MNASQIDDYDAAYCALVNGHITEGEFYAILADRFEYDEHEIRLVMKRIRRERETSWHPQRHPGGARSRPMLRVIEGGKT